jgi:hypothetical protein
MSLITKEEAQELNRNFINSKSDAMDKITGNEDSNAIWFSIEDLENFLEIAKNQLSEDGKVVDGVRVYLGSYSNDYPEKELSGMTTVFMVSNSKDENGNSIDHSEAVLNRGSNGNPPKMFFY